MPSLLDLQVNGFAGVDFNDPATTTEQVSVALEAMRHTGVGRCLPTLITDSLERFAACARTLVRHPDPAILGLHMEGPYISPEDGFRGAHPREHVRPASLDDFARRQEAAEGRIRLLTLAPEVPGALRLIEYAATCGVRVALGHTNATSAQIRDAASAGATLATHLGNGIAPMLPRHPNPIWDQLADDRLWISLIVDGHHLPAATVKAMIRAKGADRVILVTDAIAAAARPPGRYRLGSLDVELHASGRVAAPGAVTLAGSALTLDRAVALAEQFGEIAPEAARRMAVENPSTFLGEPVA